MASRERKRKQRAKRLEKASAITTDGASAPASGVGPESVESQTAKASPRPKHRPQVEEAPLPPWGKFPLVELAILVGIIVLVVGFFFVGDGAKGPVIVAGLFLCCLGGLEIAVREHVSGYKSHTLVLSALPTVSVFAALYFAVPASDFGQLPRVAIGAVIFGGCAFGLTKLFSARSGGHAFRVKAPKKR